MKEKLFGFWDYEGAELRRKFLGISLVRKASVHTLLAFGIPLMQRKRHVTKDIYKTGGGGNIIDYSFRFCGILCYTQSKYKKLARYPSLGANYLLLPTLLKEPNILPKLATLTRGMPQESVDLAYTLISRELQASQNPAQRYYALTSHELQALERLAHEFYAKILPLSPDLYYYNGYFLPVEHFESSVFFYEHGLHTLRDLSKIREKDIIDVGGFIGDSALVFARYTDKSIHCFEASPTNYQKLLKTIELNQATRIIPVNNGLGAREEKLMINICGGGSSLIFSHYSFGSEEAHIITLDSYVQQHGVEVGFIKVDIEGFEMEFIKGAKHTICTQKPTMLISIYHQASDFFDIKPLIESWNLGYEFHLHKPIDDRISLETVLFCEIPPKHRNA